MNNSLIGYAFEATKSIESEIALASSSKYEDDEDRAQSYRFVEIKSGQARSLRIKDCRRKGSSDDCFIFMNNIPATIVRLALMNMKKKSRQRSTGLGLQRFSSNSDLLPLFEHLSSCLNPSKSDSLSEHKKFQVPHYDFEFRNKLSEILGSKYESGNLDNDEL